MAIDRYENIPTKKAGKLNVVRSTLYPTIQPKPGDIYVLTNTTDRLDQLSYKYYGSVKYWWIIAHANKLSKGSMALESGLKIFIPRDINPILEEYSNLNEFYE
jgi:phage tail protein X